MPSPSLSIRHEDLDLPSPVVLVVEDEPLLQELMARLLRVHGFESRHASSVTDALAAAEHERIDAFVLDLGLGGESGLKVLEWLRTHPGYSKVPVIITTGRRMLPADQQNLLRTHGAHFLPKPHSHMSLINHLKKATRVNRES